MVVRDDALDPYRAVVEQRAKVFVRTRGRQIGEQ
jgi:hypothetical protein